MITLVFIVAVVVVLLMVVLKLSKKDIDKLRLECPKCRSNSITPVTDALWMCNQCNEWFSVKDISDNRD